MTQQQLSTVVLRLLGVSYTFQTLSSIFGAGMYLQYFSYLPTLAAESPLLMTAFLVVFLMYIGFGLILIFLAKWISSFVFPNNETLLENGEISIEAILRAGIPLLGVYVLAHETPQFVTVGIQWFKERAGPPNLVEAQLSLPMLRNTLMVFIGCFLVLKSRSISNFLLRHSL